MKNSTFVSVLQILVVGVGPLFVVVPLGCGRSEPAPRSAQDSLPSTVPALETLDLARPYMKAEEPDRAGLAEYREAGHAVSAGDVARGIVLLERSVALDPDFAEAWYQLGAARSNQAIDDVDVDEAGAAQLFRSAVDAKRRAQALMLLGKATLWSDEERAQSQAALAEALRDVDELLVSDARIVDGLRLYRAAGRPQP